jgi:hypothetical protein
MSSFASHTYFLSKEPKSLLYLFQLNQNFFLIKSCINPLLFQLIQTMQSSIFASLHRYKIHPPLTCFLLSSFYRPEQLTLIFLSHQSLLHTYWCICFNTSIYCISINHVYSFSFPSGSLSLFISAYIYALHNYSLLLLVLVYIL